MTTNRSPVRPATIIAAVLAAGALVVLVLLGNWQMRRLAWKQDLIARVAERIQSPALDLTGDKFAAIDPEGLPAENEYRPVAVEGHYVDSATVRVFTTLSSPNGALQGPGYWIFTPLETASSRIVFINRGFMPFDRLDETPSAPEGLITVSGPLRSADTGNFMTPEPDIEDRIWHIRNPVKIASALGLKGEIMPFSIDAGAEYTPLGGLPQAGETRTVFTNTHLQYALTWYGLALALVGVCAVYVFKRQNSAAA